MGDDSSGEQCMANIPTILQGVGHKDNTTKQNQKHLQHQDQLGSLILLPGNSLGPKVLHPSWERRRHVELDQPKTTQSFS